MKAPTRPLSKKRAAEGLLGRMRRARLYFLSPAAGAARRSTHLPLRTTSLLRAILLMIDGFSKPIYHHHHHQSSNRANKENWVTPALMRAMLQKNMHRLRGKKEKRKTNIAKPRGVDHMQSNASLPPLFLLFPSKKDLHQASGKSSYAPQRLSASSLRTCQQSSR